MEPHVQLAHLINHQADVWRNHDHHLAGLGDPSRPREGPLPILAEEREPAQANEAQAFALRWADNGVRP